MDDKQIVQNQYEQETQGIIPQTINEQGANGRVQPQVIYQQIPPQVIYQQTPPQVIYQQMPPQTVNVVHQSNGCGVAGFIFSILSLFLSWIPILGWVIWFLGFLLSFIGIFFSPRGLAIAGLIIACIDLFILIIILASFSVVL